MYVISCFFCEILYSWPLLNIANAISDNLAEDLGFNNDGVNLSILVYSIIFTIFTLPSNPIAKRIGAHLWIPILMNSWAVVTWAHALIHVSNSCAICSAVYQYAFIPTGL